MPRDSPQKLAESFDHSGDRPTTEEDDSSLLIPASFVALALELISNRCSSEEPTDQMQSMGNEPSHSEVLLKHGLSDKLMRSFEASHNFKDGGALQPLTSKMMHLLRKYTAEILTALDMWTGEKEHTGNLMHLFPNGIAVSFQQGSVSMEVFASEERVPEEES